MNQLASILDDLLGEGSAGSKTNRKHLCPFPGCQYRASRLAGEKKLEIDVQTTMVDGKPINKWACWSCGTKGKSIKSLLIRVGAGQEYFDRLGLVQKYTIKTDLPKTDKKTISLPKEFRFLGNIKKSDLFLRSAKAYLKKRGYTTEHIYKYNIGFCETGEYANRIIVPSYDSEGKLNYFFGRTIIEDVKPKYKFPEADRSSIVPFDLYINWSEPITLVEGGLDMFAASRNTIPLLGKTITKGILTKILDSETEKIYICMDPDAMKNAIQQCEVLLSYGKKVFLVDLPGKDPDALGFVKFTETIQKAKRLSETQLMKLKINKL